MLGHASLPQMSRRPRFDSRILSAAPGECATSRFDGGAGIEGSRGPFASAAASTANTRPSTGGALAADFFGASGVAGPFGSSIVASSASFGDGLVSDFKGAGSSFVASVGGMVAGAADGRAKVGGAPERSSSKLAGGAFGAAFAPAVGSATFGGDLSSAFVSRGESF